MRILIVVPQDEEIGGVASVVGSLSTYLVRRGHEVFFLHPAKNIFLRKKTTKLGFPGYDLRLQMPLGARHPLISIPAFLLLFPVVLFELIRLLKRHKIQVVNIHYPTDCFFYLALCKRLLGLPLITSVHGADIVVSGVPYPYYSWAFEYLLSMSERIVAPSRAFQRNFIRVFPSLEQKTTWIHSGIDLTQVQNCCPASNESNETPYLLCVSAYKEQKAIDVLIHAFKTIHRADSSVKLVIVGAGELLTAMRELAARLDVQDYIEFRGPTAKAEVLRLLRGCKLFVLPSRFETFGIVILEAMACKKPIVATRVGGIPEIIESGKNGLLVDADNPEALAEGVITILRDPKLQDKIAAEGHRTVRQFYSCENLGWRYESMFACALNDVFAITPTMTE
jgi:glycosyltransferase involved in cell wall biosynthesis